MRTRTRPTADDLMNDAGFLFTAFGVVMRDRGLTRAQLMVEPENVRKAWIREVAERVASR